MVFSEVRDMAQISKLNLSKIETPAHGVTIGEAFWV
jgi:hypothetical protein